MANGPTHKDVMRAATARKASAIQLKEKLSNIEWRMDHLYKIQDKYGKKVVFKRNEAQLVLWNNLHYLNIILKDRQRGFSTLVAMMIIDMSLWHPNVSSAIIDFKLLDAKKKLAKIKFAYDHLPEWIRLQKPLVTENKEYLEWQNGSSVAVGTSHRGATTSGILHISEYGAISARKPEIAKEIKSGALNTVALGNYVFIESTGEGKSGQFYDYCTDAMRLRDAKKPLSPLDFKFHFFAWWSSVENVLPPEYVQHYRQSEKDYFDKIEAEKKITLSKAQRAWYSRKEAQQGDEMKREFPSTETEAFESVVDGAYYAKQIVKARKEGRITRVPYDPALAVITAWDLGMGDAMTLWFAQPNGREWWIIDYYENSGEGFPHYARVLQDKPYIYSTHLMPHDSAVRELGTGLSRIESAEKLGIQPVQKIARPRGHDEFNAEVGVVRTFLAKCWFDEERCEEGITALESYRKDWNDKLGTFRDQPRHDKHSHGSDGFRTLAKGVETVGAGYLAGARTGHHVNLSSVNLM